jgi:hypothetical protein
VKIEIHVCLVLQMKRDGRLPPLGKREDHLPHIWWYTSWNGGHQLAHGWEPSGPVRNNEAYDETEKWVKRWLCPGRVD